ncbi:hypothetical protein BCR33DRAFT_715535 [Rhizoclosmatium globosum]|uniref:FAD-binding FR-type domain-containing protein n=1 Tax=Rhizoclosmatium globosum TaxID=329046 RepID=A0A1Y2CHN9_9FUNG|nr:hypothetical protein BCR33DRAFT_715535 [Rhizoclosmatium globosum]|eukprot:ORY46456.1 hypothetical protein BCR33DRAFT_715535 [Rhizoclosmatium globosum]
MFWEEYTYIPQDWHWAITITREVQFALLAIALAFVGWLFWENRYNDFLEKTKGEFADVTLRRKIPLTANTQCDYRFGLPYMDMALGLPIGQHLQVSATIDGKEVTRSYTPISEDTNFGVVDFLVKSYPTGQLSRHFDSLQIGDKIKIRGPKGNFQYYPNMVKTLCMIAIIKASLKNSADKTELNLIFANVKREDILLKNLLDSLAATQPRFKVYYVLNEADEDWEGGVGFVTKEMIVKHGAIPGDSKVLLCGPPPMVQAMQKNCEELGFAKARAVSKMEDDIFKF